LNMGRIEEGSGGRGIFIQFKDLGHDVVLGAALAFVVIPRAVNKRGDPVDARWGDSWR
jgi:hypothetical protein